MLYNRLGIRTFPEKLQVDATIQYVIFKKTGAYKDRLLYEDYDRG